MGAPSPTITVLACAQLQHQCLCQRGLRLVSRPTPHLQDQLLPQGHPLLLRVSVMFVISQITVPQPPTPPGQIPMDPQNVARFVTLLIGVSTKGGRVKVEGNVGIGGPEDVSMVEYRNITATAVVNRATLG